MHVTTGGYRPLPLNTVELLRVASSALGIGAQNAMRVAEQLYLCGYISYPRTESSAFPKGFDFGEALGAQLDQPEWGEHARWLLDGGMVLPRGGIDAGDHPPIAPVRAATAADCPGRAAGWRIYDLVSRTLHDRTRRAALCRIAASGAECRYRHVSREPESRRYDRTHGGAAVGGRGGVRGGGGP